MRYRDKFSAILLGTTLLLAVLGPASAATYYVATNGLDSAAGTNWATALLTISNAVAQTTDGDTVLVSNGTYGITAQISITNGITVRGLNGATNTIVTRTSGSIRIFYLSHTNAVVDGVTITNGNVTTQGGGVWFQGGGTLRNCLVKDNFGKYTGGVETYTGGLMESCTVVSNRATQTDFPGGMLTRNIQPMIGTTCYSFMV